MAALGLVILWAGYLAGITGYSKIKAATSAAPRLSLSDLALPSHRATYMAAAGQWSSANPNAGTGPAPPTVTGGNPILGGGTVAPPASAMKSQSALRAWLHAEYPWLTSFQIDTLVAQSGVKKK